MDIHHLKVFMAVYRRRSFSKASKELHLSQPTVSEHIKNLESGLDCRLFDRLGRSIIPTEAADQLFLIAEKIVDEMDTLPEKIRSATDVLKRVVEIGASTIPGSYILPSVIAGFVDTTKKASQEGVSFRVIIGDTGRITEMVLNHEISLGVVGARMEDQRLSFTPFRKDELILVAAPGMLKADTIDLAFLESIPLVMREEGSGTRKTMEMALARKGINPDGLSVSVLTGSTEAVKECVKAGLGASFLSGVAVRDELKRGVLKEVRVKGLRMKRRFYFVTHRKRSLPRVVMEFMDFCSAARGA